MSHQTRILKLVLSFIDNFSSKRNKNYRRRDIIAPLHILNEQRTTSWNGGSEMSRLPNIIQLMSALSQTDGADEKIVSQFNYICVCVRETERTPGCYGPNLTSSWPFSVCKLIQFCTDTGSCELVKLIWLLPLPDIEQAWNRHGRKNNDFSLCIYGMNDYNEHILQCTAFRSMIALNSCSMFSWDLYLVFLCPKSGYCLTTLARIHSVSVLWTSVSMWSQMKSMNYTTLCKKERIQLL